MDILLIMPAILKKTAIGESLFFRKLVLGIPAQASSKNLTRPLMPPAAPIRPRHPLKIFTSLKLRFQDFQRGKVYAAGGIYALNLRSGLLRFLCLVTNGTQRHQEIPVLRDHIEKQNTGAPCYLTTFWDSCHQHSFAYAANGRCPGRPASVSTTHKTLLR
ncbi:hypothetical protein [Bathymodiolus japonicus methanotrophic gill symbiont]|uniref:hypothetical protein n=1 Tax=Bathymodiolus japonicus methanotrophic gill symbiont TaxID=113269 RepID=UPI001C8D63A5|nr:hypothetical protein [Bathymodiolus japonicus methanotrophic gill symbiont]